MDSLQNIDIALLRSIQQNRPEALDQVFYYISFFATWVNIGAMLIILFISIYKRSKTLRMIFFKLSMVFLIAALTSFIIKNLTTRERPFKTYPDIEKLSEAGSSSFPSGHTMEVFALATAFSVSFPKKKYFIPAFAWACLVAYTRMALGVHYPADVLGGAVFGILIGWLVPMIFLRGKGEKEKR